MASTDSHLTDGHGPLNGAAPIAALSLADEVRRRTGINPARCYQCGKCSAGCPMSEETGLRPHDVLRLVQMNRRDKALSADGMWLCVGCEACTARCPNECDPAAVIDELRAIAMAERPDDVPRHLAAFHRSFLDQVKAHGRLSELGLMVTYKLRTGALFQDATAGPGMVTRGKLHLAPPKIRGVDEVRAIFRRCEEAER